MNSARSFLLNALAQSDVDMNNHKLLNLDISNLSISGLPPTVTPPANNFLTSWNRVTQVWGFALPSFSNLSGFLTLAQMLNITQLGTISTGVWAGSIIVNNYLPTLDGLRAPLGVLNLNNQKIVNLANPSNALDAVNFQTMNTMVPGLQVRAPVAAATVSDNPLSGLNPVDGYTPNVGDRILVMAQATGRHFQNGVWIAATGAWARASDFSTSAEFNSAYVLCLNGTINANIAFVQITPAPVDITGPDTGAEPNFVIFTLSSTIIAGPGLRKSGNVISAIGTPGQIVVGGGLTAAGIGIDTTYRGQTSIDTLGTITAGTWQGNLLSPSYGGTGNNNGTNQIILNAGTLQIEPPGYGGIVIGQLMFQTLSLPTVLTLPPAGTLATLSGMETFTNKSIDASNIKTGVLTISVGGTGAATAMLAALNLLPPVAGNAGLSLKTDGATIFWG